MFFAIARDPERLRPLMPLAIVEKSAFFATCIALFVTGRMAGGPVFVGGLIDGVWMALFAWAWLACKPVRP